jgi:hypothetical protein
MLPKLDSVKIPTLPQASHSRSRGHSLSSNLHPNIIPLYPPPNYLSPPSSSNHPPTARVVANLGGGAQIVVRPDTSSGSSSIEGVNGGRNRSGSVLTANAAISKKSLEDDKFKTPTRNGMLSSGSTHSRRPNTSTGHDHSINPFFQEGQGHENRFEPVTPTSLVRGKNARYDSPSDASPTVNLVDRFRKKLSHPKLRPSTTGTQPSEQSMLAHNHTPVRSLRHQATTDDFRDKPETPVSVGSSRERKRQQTAPSKSTLDGKSSFGKRSGKEFREV